MARPGARVRRMGEVGLGDADRRDIAGRRHQPGGVAAGEGAQVTADQPGLYRAGGTAYLERPGACWRAPGLICLLRDASAPGERAATDDDIDSPYRSLAGKMQVRHRARPPIHMLMLAVPGVRLGSSVASCGTRARRLTGVRHGELPEPSRAAQVAAQWADIGWMPIRTLLAHTWMFGATTLTVPGPLVRSSEFVRAIPDLASTDARIGCRLGGVYALPGGQATPSPTTRSWA